MVTTFKTVLLGSLIIFLMMACSDKKKELNIIIEPTSFQFSQAGGSKTFGITPNEPATLQSSETWCKVILENNTPVQAFYKITVEPNTTPEIRHAVITVCVKEHVEKISIEQAAYIHSEEKPEKYTVRENLTTHQLINEMGLGINLGNTLDAVGDWINPSSILNYEQAWGSPVITQDIIEGYAKAGYSSLRIPVSWGNLLSDDFKVHPDLMDRVEKILNWTLDCGMVAIINIHHENEWIKQVPIDSKAKEKYTSIWKQICQRFEKYGDHLLFEPMNEIGYDEIWTPWSGSEADKTKALGYVNDLNQLFVDIVRNSGGNNAKRHLLVEIYNTGIEYAYDPLFKMPDDPANRLAITVHYYTPATFAILGAGEDAGWGVGQESWGTEQDFKELNNNMDLLKKKCVDKGIPVIIGEYCASSQGRTQEVVRLFCVAVTEAIYSRGMCPMLWDTPGGQYNRQTCQFDDPLFLEEMTAIPAKYPRD